jgi:quinoprotein glucose dehydrogenase
MKLRKIIQWALPALLTAGLWGQTTGRDGEWATYGGDLKNTRYRPFDQINASNFNKLEVAWRFKTDSLGNRPEFKLEGTPLMVGGVIYATAGTRRAVVALDAATGELLWVHGEREGARGAAAPRGLSGRGLAYWTDGRQGRILYITPGYHMVSLDAKTGAPVRTFGDNGVVDLKLNDDQDIDLVNGEIGYQSAPIIAKDTILVGAAFLDGGVPKSKTNNKGYVRGFDVRTGKRLWIFHTIPLKGEFGYDTWLNGAAENTGNAGSWAQMAVDEELGLAYLPVELPTSDYYGGNRPGAGLFGETLVCVDLKTGKRKWHYQLIHHGVWDQDISAPPILADITVDGRQIKAVAQPTKQAVLYVFDRVTGQPVWPIEEKPVEKGDVPGEWYSPTQPFPSKPPAYDRNGVSIDDLIDFTPELRAEAVNIVKKYKIGPIFTPPSLSKADGPLATLLLATNGGGSNWPGGSYDPESHTLFVSSCSSCLQQIGIVPVTPDISDMGYVGGMMGQTPRPRGGVGAGANADALAVAPARGGRGAGNAAAAGGADGAPAAGRGGLTVRGLPLIKPPYGRMTAIDLDRGEIKWQIAQGETPDAIRNSAVLKGLKIPRTGQTGLAPGTMVTKTLLIVGDGQGSTSPAGARGAMLRAYDKQTGNEVGAVYLPAPQSGTPMTYMLNGKQYIVVAVSGGAYSGEYMAFALPSE